MPKLITKKNMTYVVLTGLAVWFGTQGIPLIVNMVKSRKG
jgi:hypothetical protein